MLMAERRDTDTVMMIRMKKKRGWLMIRMKKRGWFAATTMALSCCGWCGMRFAPSPLPPLIMNHFSLESGAKPPDPAKGGKAVRRPRTVSELESEPRSKVAAGGEKSNLGAGCHNSRLSLLGSSRRDFCPE